MAPGALPYGRRSRRPARSRSRGWSATTRCSSADTDRCRSCRSHGAATSATGLSSPCRTRSRPASSSSSTGGCRGTRGEVAVRPASPTPLGLARWHRHRRRPEPDGGGVPWSATGRPPPAGRGPARCPDRAGAAAAQLVAAAARRRRERGDWRPRAWSCTTRDGLSVWAAPRPVPGTSAATRSSSCRWSPPSSSCRSRCSPGRRSRSRPAAGTQLAVLSVTGADSRALRQVVLAQAALVGVLAAVSGRRPGAALGPAGSRPPAAGPRPARPRRRWRPGGSCGGRCRRRGVGGGRAGPAVAAARRAGAAHGPSARLDRRLPVVRPHWASASSSWPPVPGPVGRHGDLGPVAAVLAAGASGWSCSPPSPSPCSGGCRTARPPRLRLAARESSRAGDPHRRGLGRGRRGRGRPRGDAVRERRVLRRRSQPLRARPRAPASPP